MLVVNLNQDKSKTNRYLSDTLLKEIEKNLKNNKKIILYLNKRGDYSSLVCNKCSHLFKCDNCDISMSIHNTNMICHICNFSKPLEKKCEKCNNTELQKIGVGTSQIEDTIKQLFGNYNVFRFDTDVVKNKTEKAKALENLKQADIIIGTKMITTGFDFQNVGLIGVILLEQELQIPKYNTEEKVYSNIKQLLGRGGRRGEETTFVIQTFIPENSVIKLITESNYKDFFIKTLEERKLFHYPPYCEIATLEYRHLKQEKALDFITKLKDKLNNNNPNKIEILQIPNYSRRFNQYFYKIIIKGDNLRDFLKCIKKDIFSNSNLVVIFD